MALFLLFLLFVPQLILPCRQVRAWRRCFVRLVLPVGVLVVLATRVDLSHAGDEAPTAGKDAARVLFRQHCQRCHGADGAAGQGGSPVFTSRAWQERRTDVQLVVSILEGKGTGMPAFSGRLSDAQARSLVAHIRALAPARSRTAATDSSSPPESADDFTKQFQQLQKEFDGLQRQLKELDSESRLPNRSSAPSVDGSGDAEGVAKLVRTGGPLYRRHCHRCHGADGKGDPEQISSDDCPDFSSRDWHEQRSHARLQSSILKGTKGGMPAFRRLSETEIRALVAYIRSFAQRTKTSPDTSTPQQEARQHRRPGIGRVIRGLSPATLAEWANDQIAAILVLPPGARRQFASYGKRFLVIQEGVYHVLDRRDALTGRDWRPAWRSSFCLK